LAPGRGQSSQLNLGSGPIPLGGFELL
jgi:hypothetical protein